VRGTGFRGAGFSALIIFATAWGFASTAWSIPGAPSLPAVRPIITPPPNSSGWNNTDVTVSFVCENAVTCPGPVTFDREGAAQQLTREVHDSAGHAATATVTINIDRTPARIQLETATDRNGLWFSVPAAVADDLSGIANARCNGRAATIDRGMVSCVLPARDGLNDIAITAVDQAGNVASASLQVPRRATSAAVEVVPSAATVPAGGGRRLQLLDSAGDQIAAERWSVTDPTIARVTAQGVVIGLAPGQTSITAFASGQSASMVLTVKSPAEFKAPGTTIWQMNPYPGDVAGEFARLSPVLFSLEHDASYQQTVARVVSTDADYLWTEFPATAPGERIRKWMGDYAGGVLTWVEGSAAGPSAIVRIGRAIDDAPTWRFESASPVTGFWAGIPYTLFVVEVLPNGYGQVTLFDSMTGAVKHRVVLPHTIVTRDVGNPASAVAIPAQAGPITFPDDKAAATPFVLTDYVDDGNGRRLARKLVNVLRVTDAGEAHIVPLTQFVETVVATLPEIELHYVVPDGHDALIALMRLQFKDGRSEGRVVRLAADNTRSEYSLPTAGDYVLGEDWAYTCDGRTLVAFDPQTGKVAWTRQPEKDRFELIYATGGGGVVVRQGDLVLFLNSAGAIAHVETHPVGFYPIF